MYKINKLNEKKKKYFTLVDIVLDNMLLFYTKVPIT
jgi:hypothetical protein